MCGIVGIIDTRGESSIDSDLLSRMNEIQHHRGPDEVGIHTEPGVGLGHRRLSIIDLKSGKQPLFNEDQTVVVVYNGEIYNFPDLMSELRDRGHSFRTRCDTEVIVHAWEEWGEQCVDRFRGMFAFAIWDRNKQTAFLARDRLGIKPLYYSMLPNGHLVFSSELKALLLHPRLSKKIEPQSVEEYFAYGYIPDPNTIYTSTFKLPPGHLLTMKRGGRIGSPVRYWDIPFIFNAVKNESELQQEIVERLREAVRIRLISEVPIGAFLSGGVDSSAVVAMMASLSNSPVNTCSIAFGHRNFDESEYASLVAKQYQTNHHVDHVDPDSFDLVDILASVYDEPYADSSAIPTYHLCEMTRKQVTVALSGDGGDENFAGYRRYFRHQKEEHVRSYIPLSIRRKVFGGLAWAYPKADWAPRFLRAKATFQTLARDPIAGYMHGVSVMGDEIRERLFSKALKQQLQGYNAVEVLRKHAGQAPVEDPVSLVQYLDLKTYLPGDILTKVDRASMAHSLEVRVPILDHKFVEWVSGLPVNLKLKGSEGKYLFKKSMEDYLPNDILYRRKMGFAVPISNWFRGPLKERVQKAVLGHVLEETGFFNHGFLKRMVEKHQMGIRDYSGHLWSLLMFESFLRK